jgi:hypothetical protein
MFHARFLDTTEKHADCHRYIVLLEICDVLGKPNVDATLFGLSFYPLICFIYIFFF